MIDLKEKIDAIKHLGRCRMTGNMGRVIAECFELILQELQPKPEDIVEDVYKVRDISTDRMKHEWYEIYHTASKERTNHFSSCSKEEAEDTAMAMNIARKLRKIREKSNEIEKAGGNGGIEGLFSESLAGGPGDSKA